MISVFSVVASKRWRPCLSGGKKKKDSHATLSKTRPTFLFFFKRLPDDSSRYSRWQSSQIVLLLPPLATNGGSLEPFPFRTKTNSDESSWSLQDRGNDECEWKGASGSPNRPSESLPPLRILSYSRFLQWTKIWCLRRSTTSFSSSSSSFIQLTKIWCLMRLSTSSSFVSSSS